VPNTKPTILGRKAEVERRNSINHSEIG